MSLVQLVRFIWCSKHVPALSTLGSLHDNHILYPVIKVLYALHTLLERIAASKTLESPRGDGRVMNKAAGKDRRDMRGRNKGRKRQIKVEEVEEGEEEKELRESEDNEVGGVCLKNERDEETMHGRTFKKSRWKDG